MGQILERSGVEWSVAKWNAAERWHCPLGLYFCEWTIGWGGAGGYAPCGMVQGYFGPIFLFFFLFDCSPKRPLGRLQPRHPWSSTSSAPLTTSTMVQGGKWLIQATSWVDACSGAKMAPELSSKWHRQWGRRQNGVWTTPIPNRNTKNDVEIPLHQVAFSLRCLETTQHRMEIALLTGIWNAWKRRLEHRLKLLKMAPGTPSGTPENGTWNAV